VLHKSRYVYVRFRILSITLGITLIYSIWHQSIKTLSVILDMLHVKRQTDTV
jgi:hypothetical protein